MSIPQATDAAEDQQKAIASLVSYVSDSKYFVVLAGAWTHENGEHKDEIAWSGRGVSADLLSPFCLLHTPRASRAPMANSRGLPCLRD